MGALPSDGGRSAGDAVPPTSLPSPVRADQGTIGLDLLELTIHADGRSEHRLAGATPFRHWVYDTEGNVSEKSGRIGFRRWYHRSFGKHTPWGGEDFEAVVAAVETALERELSTTIMRGGEKPDIRKVKEGEVLMRQGDPGEELFLLLDGILRVEVDGKAVADLGPGAVLGERALLEGGRRTSTLTAVTPAKVAVARAAQMDPAALEELSAGHRREEDTN